VFKKGEIQASAYGSFIHVFVNRKEQRSVSIPLNIRAALEALLILENPKLVK
jgi:acyl-CoA thioester hydrolase